MAVIVVVLVSCVLLPLAAGLSSVVELYVLEELPPGSYVGNVAIDADVYDRYSLKVAATLRFRILFQSLPSAASSSGVNSDAAVEPLFSVEELTGDVRTVLRIDREKYCHRAGRCVARVDVVVQPTAFFEIVRARVHILDINDNAPVFPVPVLDFALPESRNANKATSPSAGFLVPEADDPDSPAFGVQRYVVVAVRAEEDEEMTSASVPFDVNYRHGELRLLPTQVLDREKVSR